MDIPRGLSFQGNAAACLNPLPYIVRAKEGVFSRMRNTWFKALGVRLGGYVWMRKISIPRNWSDITIEAGAALDSGVVLLCSGNAKPGKILIRSGVYINRFTMFDAREQIHLGKDCMIGPHCYITDGDHGMALGTRIGDQPMVAKPVLLEEGVWLGAGVVVLKGVTVGRHAVVGAGAVVVKDVPPYSKVAGVPARLIGQRT